MKVDVGGYKLFIRCTGQGTPPAVLDSGASSGSSVWCAVEPQLASFTTTCAYDRANREKSDNGPIPNTSKQMVNDLRTLLANVHIAGPFVLVGQSFGGMNMGNAQRLGRSTQTISDLTIRARQSLRCRGPIVELIVAAQQVMNLGVVETQAGLAFVPAGIARETLIRLDAGRPAMPHVVDQLADALGDSRGTTVSSGPTVEDGPVLTTFPLHSVVIWREFRR